MRTHCRTLILTAALTLLVASVPALAGPHGRHGRGFDGPGAGFGAHGPGFVRLLEDLDLTDSQRVEVDGLIEAHREAMASRLELVQERRDAVADRVHADVVDAAAIRAAVQELAAVEAEIAVERATLLGEVRDLLTPAQREQMAQKMERHRERMERRGGPGSRGFGGPGRGRGSGREGYGALDD